MGGFSHRDRRIRPAGARGGQQQVQLLALVEPCTGGITSFSTVPLRLWSYVGAGVSLFAFAFAVYMLVDKMLHGNDVPGYLSMMTAILFWEGCS